MAFYTDQVVTGVPSSGGGGSTTSLTPPLFPVTPSNEIQAFQGTTYYYSDCIGDETNYQSNGFGPSTIAGIGSIKANEITGPIVRPGGNSNGFLALCPGIMYLHATTATTTNNLLIYTSQPFQSASLPVFPNGPKVVANIMFFTPRISNAADTFSFLVGNIGGNSVSANLVQHGVGIHYSHTSNGGNWSLKEFSAAAVATLASSTVPFAQLTWHKLTLIYNGTPNTITCFLSVAGTTTSQVIASGVTSTFLNSGKPLLLTGAGMELRKSTSTGAVVSALVDYWSLGIDPTGRAW